MAKNWFIPVLFQEGNQEFVVTFRPSAFYSVFRATFFQLPKRCTFSYNYRHNNFSSGWKKHNPSAVRTRNLFYPTQQQSKSTQNFMGCHNCFMDRANGGGWYSYKGLCRSANGMHVAKFLKSYKKKLIRFLWKIFDRRKLEHWFRKAEIVRCQNNLLCCEISMEDFQNLWSNQ